VYILKQLVNAVEAKEDVRSVNAQQGCSHTELRIVVNSKKLVYLTSRITALSFITFSTLTPLFSTPGVFRNFSKELHNAVPCIKFAVCIQNPVVIFHENS